MKKKDFENTLVKGDWKKACKVLDALAIEEVVENYKKNPVILANHDSKPENIIGKAISVREDGIIIEVFEANSRPE